MFGYVKGIYYLCLSSIVMVINFNIMETELIEQYIKLYAELKIAENKLETYFNEVVDEMLKTATSTSDFIAIKERLRIMPICASKALLFRKIILMENNIK